MTARAIIPPSVLRAAAMEANANGVVVTITMPDGTVCTVAPATNAGQHDPFDVVDLRK
jgi:Fe-S oxidoreductase